MYKVYIEPIITYRFSIFGTVWKTDLQKMSFTAEKIFPSNFQQRKNWPYPDPLEWILFQKPQELYDIELS